MSWNGAYGRRSPGASKAQPEKEGSCLGQGRRGAGGGQATSLPPGPGAPALVLERAEVRAVQMPFASEVMNPSNVP